MEELKSFNMLEEFIFFYIYSKSLSLMSDEQTDIARLDILTKCIKLIDLQG